MGATEAIERVPLLPALERALRGFAPKFARDLPGILGTNAGTLTFLLLVTALTLLVWKLTEGIDEAGAPGGAGKGAGTGGAKGAGVGGKSEESLKYYTKEEVAKHNTTESLWLIIEDRREDDAAKRMKVYDFTEFLDAHPGGDAALMQNAGGDATKGFYGPQHSDGVMDQAPEFHIGYLKE